jgi:hypothetical protein
MFTCTNFQNRIMTKHPLHTIFVYLIILANWFFTNEIRGIITGFTSTFCVNGVFKVITLTL